MRGGGLQTPSKRLQQLEGLLAARCPHPGAVADGQNRRVPAPFRFSVVPCAQLGPGGTRFLPLLLWLQPAAEGQS